MKIRVLATIACASIGFLTAGCAADENGEDTAPMNEETDSPTENNAGVDGEDDATATGETVGKVESAMSADDCIRLTESDYVQHVYKPEYDRWYDFPYSTARIKNNCKSAKRVRLIWRWAQDGRCIDLAPGKTHFEQRGRALRPDPYITQVRRC